MKTEQELGPPDAGYTYFGCLFYRLLRSRGHNQSTFAAECRRRRMRLGGPGKERDVGQRSISDWMHGRTACPREIPAIADTLLNLSEEEWMELGLAVAYGQTTPEEDIEDVKELRMSYLERTRG